MIQYSHGCKLNKVQVAGALLGLADAIETLKEAQARASSPPSADCLMLGARQSARPSVNQPTS
jgi:hypothetical protein